MAVDQYAFTAPFEGVIPHLYLDGAGNPTCGVGFLVATDTALCALPWSPNVQAAQADLQTIRGLPGHSAAFYQPYCKARLSDASMQAVFAVKVDTLRRALQPMWGLTLLPEPAQLALVDMAYNLGADGLNKFAKLRAAVAARDWLAAAKECHRVERPAPNGVQPARNAATASLFQQLAG